MDSDKVNAVEYNYLHSKFCGKVVDVHNEHFDALTTELQRSSGIVFVCGNIPLLLNSTREVADNVKVVKELSYGLERYTGLQFVTLGNVPINVHNVGVYYRDCLGGTENYFDTIQVNHEFQALTESNKSGISFRKGIYLSEVITEDDTTEFNLLRCSTNLNGPTLAFADEDRKILFKVNKLATKNFDQPAELNHVLAQMYENSVTIDASEKSKDHKAKTKSHSDKTKDMPTNGLIAFCTFYSFDIEKYKSKLEDRFNRYFKNASVLTQLRFKLKDDVISSALTKSFSVTLYPNSVLIIPLSTNRLYTREIVPPQLPVGRFPTRLGYVVRCSNTKALFKGGATYIRGVGGEDVKLRDASDAGAAELKRLYQKENVSSERVEYGDVCFSLNKGDYQRPLIE